MANQLSGSCLCCAITYTVSNNPIKSIICHYNHCKKAGGSAFAVSTWFRRSTFKPIDPKSRLRSYEGFKTDTQRLIIRYFCSVCAGRLYLEIPHMPDVVSIMRGSMDGLESDTVGETRASVPDRRLRYIVKERSLGWRSHRQPRRLKCRRTRTSARSSSMRYYALLSWPH